MEVILKYFPELTTQQRQQFGMLQELYSDWNAKINVVSRKDIDKLYIHHVLHSLAIARVISFAKGTRVLDVGTGGGFPGIPLAILFPAVSFTLVDSIGKKITVVNEVSSSLQLANVVAQKARAEELKDTFDFVVTRAVAPMPTIMGWVRGKVKPGGFNHLPNGIIALKGGDIRAELAPLGKAVQRWKISDLFEEEYFEEKKVVFVPR
ncbi:16S rRNA (guanine(527)-N(7))-methyltransferase RsmG [Perlabentimonas gracilis]|uniref:16S rRNA (guanine(527)-N(7))-methyltransferase RsmG n=1 Tax=Perlabentimonas gracilis TaxID=2715279 RepID=UPI00140E8C18|nr:16S rRNA (guanine(527)-N(7))-methyltransferase RsmG [Perlabentimonas gracilis]NHB67375.1 16S rRNA (guanine(527)-N(7))-methyltransferase RsmG [Perlabentimonas gracilis]